MLLNQDQKSYFQSIIDSLNANHPKPSESGMLRLSNDKNELEICICTDSNKKESFKRFVAQKGHKPEEQLIQKIEPKTLYHNGREISYVYFHKLALIEELGIEICKKEMEEF